MDIRDLRYFETIAELQHVGRAAQQLHRTQPALTSSVRRLEAECGSALFERAGRGIRLTPAGEALLRWARRVRHDMEDAKREVAALRSGLAGHVRIGIVPTAAQFLLPAAARKLLKEAPGVTLRTVVGLVDSLKPMLIHGDLDIVIASETHSHAGLVSRVVAEDAIVVAASAGHEVFQRSPTLRRLTQYQWALQPEGAPPRDWLDHTFDRRGLPRPKVQVESTMLLMLPTLIAETGLLSFISRHHLNAKHARAGLKEVALRETTMIRKMVVMHREQAYLSTAARRLVSLLAAETEDHKGGVTDRPPRKGRGVPGPG